MPELTDWVDVSVTVRHGMAHWPGNPPIVLERVLGLGRGDDSDGVPAWAILRPLSGHYPGQAAGMEEAP